MKLNNKLFVLMFLFLFSFSFVVSQDSEKSLNDEEIDSWKNRFDDLSDGEIDGLWNDFKELGFESKNEIFKVLGDDEKKKFIKSVGKNLLKGAKTPVVDVSSVKNVLWVDENKIKIGEKGPVISLEELAKGGGGLESVVIKEASVEFGYSDGRSFETWLDGYDPVTKKFTYENDKGEKKELSWDGDGMIKIRKDDKGNLILGLRKDDNDKLPQLTLPNGDKINPVLFEYKNAELSEKIKILEKTSELIDYKLPKEGEYKSININDLKKINDFLKRDILGLGGITFLSNDDAGTILNIVETVTPLLKESDLIVRNNGDGKYTFEKISPTIVTYSNDGSGKYSVEGGGYVKSDTADLLSTGDFKVGYSDGTGVLFEGNNIEVGKGISKELTIIPNRDIVNLNVFADPREGVGPLVSIVRPSDQKSFTPSKVTVYGDGRILQTGSAKFGNNIDSINVNFPKNPSIQNPGAKASIHATEGLKMQKTSVVPTLSPIIKNSVGTPLALDFSYFDGDTLASTGSSNSFSTQRYLIEGDNERTSFISIEGGPTKEDKEDLKNQAPPGPGGGPVPAGGGGGGGGLVPQLLLKFNPIKPLIPVIKVEVNPRIDNTRIPVVIPGIIPLNVNLRLPNIIPIGVGLVRPAGPVAVGQGGGVQGGGVQGGGVYTWSDYARDLIELNFYDYVLD